MNDWLNFKNMAKKNKPDNRGFVYSTDPDFHWENEHKEQVNTLAPEKQKLYIRLDTKQRAGKAVSLVEGFLGKEEDLEALGRSLKTHCGTGGSVKEGVIIIQGDQREKIFQWLMRNTYSLTKKY
jgi:translation initiation factor 1